ncbi:DUF6474 family protein [Actinosynnema sp. NPDC047251]|uniref:Uncharacterized protein n=1 Tax=Saccharothrix espanaensis (strain ATCC 51144 / DSM 44229 / JCM 9112 / NBRC 15066 / NRRL 15764) TaxID=1179773 RepID=K0JNL3_SACES|nr:DUF6474 family protein [Saccharothrix espanaensis]CCH27385.1 hypothetical protein BN6_00530 [Saccharothrix espanaensis DSM 44229]
MARERSKGFTPGRAKNLVGVAKVVAPALIPVVAPLAARAAAAVSDRYDQYRARKLGVPVDELSRYSGHGARLYARITGFAQALEDVRGQDREYVESTEARLTQLTAAVRASERMPTPRRKAAHRAVGADLDVLEAELLRRLGVS